MPCKILLVECDSHLRELLCHVAGEHCEVGSAEDARQAAQALSDETFDIVILNMEMREGDALRVADDAAAHGAAVIVIPESTEDRRKAVTRGYQTLLKPFRMQELRAVIESVLAPSDD